MVLTIDSEAQAVQLVQCRCERGYEDYKAAFDSLLIQIVPHSDGSTKVFITVGNLIQLYFPPDAISRLKQDAKKYETAAPTDSHAFNSSRHSPLWDS